MSQRRPHWLLLAFISCVPAVPLGAQSAENVAVVINDASPESQRVGEHYARVRGLAPSNVFRIKTRTDDVIERADYVRTIETPIGTAIRRGGLQDRVIFLVLTKGIPLRIAGTPGQQGTLASVDSELTLLYRRLTGQASPLAGFVENPYFLGTRALADARAFSHRQHDIYLVTRLDGYTTEDATALVDRGQATAEQLSPDAQIVLDQSAAMPSSRLGDEWMAQAARRLQATGHEGRVLLETTPQAAQTTEPLIGRYAWGAADPAQRSRTTTVKFAGGAIAANLASFDARTFRAPPQTWKPSTTSSRASLFEGSADALIGDLVQAGVTGVSGQVGEAFLRGAVRPDILFPAYLAGFTLAEAFYLAMPTLSWQAIVVGDPLASPFGDRRLTSAELEDGIDATTGLPGLFSQRRIAVLAALNRNVPPAAIAPMLRAQLLLERDEKATALVALKEALEIAPRNPNWLTTIAMLHEQAGDYEAAIASYREVLTLQNRNVVALNNIAYALAVHVARPAEGLPFAQEAATLAPKVGTVIDTLAWIEHLLGSHESAAKWIGEAVKLDGRNAEIRLHAAVVLAAVNRRAESETHLKEALRLDPSLEGRPEVRKLQGRP